MHSPRSTLAVLPLVLACASVQAQPPAPAEGGSLGLGIATAPIYQGADTTRESAIPLVEYHWASGLFVGGRGVVGMQFSRHPKVQYGVVLGYDIGRKQGDSRRLDGMGDIAGTATLGGFVNFMPTRQINLSASHKFGSGNDHQGLEMEWGASFAIPLAQSTQLSLSAAATLANASYMQSYFGVDARQAAASGHKRYSPTGGLRDIKASLGLNYQITPVWALTSGLMFTTLSKLATDSPLVRKANNTSAFVGVVRRF